MWRLGFLAFTVLAACAPDLASRTNRGAILLLGDDLLAAPEVATALSATTNTVTLSQAQDGARAAPRLPSTALQGRDIPEQYRADAYAWVVVTGGTEDLRRRCGCRDCDETLDEVIGLTGRGGAMFDLVTQISQSRSRVLLVGYPPQAKNDGCADDIRELNNRFSRLADLRADVFYVSAASEITPDTPEYYDGNDLTPQGSAALGTFLGQTISQPE